MDTFGISEIHTKTLLLANIVMVVLIVVSLFLIVSKELTILKDKLTQVTVSNKTEIIKLKEELKDTKKLMYSVQTNARVTLTYYSPDKEQTDNDPYITAFLVRVRVGFVAVSRDLMDRGWTPGKRVYIPGKGVYIIADLMNERKGNWIDVFVNTEQEADELGITRNVVASLFLGGLRENQGQ